MKSISSSITITTYFVLFWLSVHTEAFMSGLKQSGSPASKLSVSFFNAGNDKKVGGNKGVLVVGATGKTGKRIVEVLLKKGRKVTAGVRDLAKGEEALGKAGNKLSFLEVDVVADSPATLAEKVTDYSAVICATGYSPSGPIDLLGPYKVDNMGTTKLAEALVAAGVPKMVLVSSLLTNGWAAGQGLNKNYIILNLFGGVLVAKNTAERKIMATTGLDWTIVRPGGLRESPPEGRVKYGKADTLFGGSISRYSVAEVCVAALDSKAASRKIVEIVSEGDAPKLTFEQGFASA
ncbi:putative chloroplastic-like protein [Nannochloropsis gaditana]|uniref:Putative chloroplastic-like protein n=1 Tax=Nannochloropsis gaditana TaxID=72520 RepID=W7TB10_9STRA|nr:putative chloroplastic-like protein [Nannochloropsis gaditana]